jgi:hypothetical protein
MARPLRIEFPGALYHITSRGNAQNKIYLNDADRHEESIGSDSIGIDRRLCRQPQIPGHDRRAAYLMNRRTPNMYIYTA